MAAIAFKGPIAKVEVEDIGTADWLTAVTATVDDIMEEALEFPKESEATANLADGTPEQASVSLPFALPVLDTATAFHTGLAGFATARTRVKVRVTTADGTSKTYGGTQGLRVRKLIDDNLAPDAFPVTVYMFHGVYSKSGDGVGAVVPAA